MLVVAEYARGFEFSSMVSHNIFGASHSISVCLHPRSATLRESTSVTDLWPLSVTSEPREATVIEGRWKVENYTMNMHIISVKS